MKRYILYLDDLDNCVFVYPTKKMLLEGISRCLKKTELADGETVKFTIKKYN